MHRLEKFTQAYPQVPWRSQIQLLGLVLAVVVVLALIAGIYLSVSARSAAFGREIQEMQRLIRAMERDNESLRAILAELTSSRNLEERSEELDYIAIDPSEAYYVVVDGYSGRPPVTLASRYEDPVVGARVMPDEYTESLFDWLGRTLSPYVQPIIEDFR